MDEAATEVATEADLAELARRVDERLAARRAAGELPDSLEAELDRYVRMYAALHTVELPQDRARHETRRALDRPPFGSAVQQGIARYAAAPTGVARLANDLQRWREGVEGALVACLAAIDRYEADGLPAARDALTLVLDRLSALEVLEATVAGLEDRLQAVEDRLAGGG